MYIVFYFLNYLHTYSLPHGAVRKGGLECNDFNYVLETRQGENMGYPLCSGKRTYLHNYVTPK